MVQLGIVRGVADAGRVGANHELVQVGLVPGEEALDGFVELVEAKLGGDVHAAPHGRGDPVDLDA